MHTPIIKFHKFQSFLANFLIYIICHRFVDYSLHCVTYYVTYWSYDHKVAQTQFTLHSEVHHKMSDLIRTRNGVQT